MPKLTFLADEMLSRVSEKTRRIMVESKAQKKKREKRRGVQRQKRCRRLVCVRDLS
jgi:hypothetical protein